MSSVQGEKADEAATHEKSPPPQCQYLVPRKKRLCRMTVRPGRRYCGEHDRLDSGETALAADPRIPCPLDPKHTCYASKLDKHVRVCNARCDSAPSYIRISANAVTGDDDRPRLKDVPSDKLKTVVQLIETLYRELVCRQIVHRIERDDSAVHPAVACDYNLERRRHSSRRHLRQTSSLIHALQREHLTRPGTCFVELGAGKGHVSYYLARALEEVPSCSVLLVDRASHRHKQDNKLDPSRHQVQRIRADISDLLLDRVPQVAASSALVAVSKHLCGKATDYALRCVTADDVVAKTRGVVMATCCHHRCTAADYVALDFLQEVGITREYFDIMMGVVSWATCGTGYSRERSREQVHEKRTKLTNNVGQTDKDSDKSDIQDTEAENEECDGVEVSKSIESYISYESNSVNELGLMDVNLELARETAESTNKKSHSNQPNSESQSILKEAKQELVASEITVEKPALSEGEPLPYLTDSNSELSDVKGLGLSVARRTEVGRHAKAILDYGRCVYLKSHGFDSQLCYYVDVEVSPENVCIIAKK